MKRILLLSCLCLCLCAAVCACEETAQEDLPVKSPDQVQLDSIVTRYYDAKKAARNDLVTDDLYRDMQREVDAFFDSVEIRDWHYLLGELRLEDESAPADTTSSIWEKIRKNIESRHVD